MDRSKYIGGSDAAGVLARSRWDTPLSVWCEKTGQFIKPEVESEAAELGKELEDYIAKRFARKTGKTVVRCDDLILHPDYDFLGAHVDRLIEGEDAGLECKTASAWKSKEWEGEEIPQEYILQCYHYMMVTGRKKWYLAVLIGNQDFKIKELLWDDKIINNMRDAEIAFWDDFVVPKVIPGITAITRFDADTLQGLFPVATEGKEIELEDEANISVETITALKQDIKTCENMIELHENILKRLLGDAEIGQTSTYRIGWTNSKWSGLDGKALKESMPEIHARFYKSKPIRKFGYKPLKGEKQ